METKPSIGDLRDPSSQLVSEGELKAGLPNTFFASVFTCDDQDDPVCKTRQGVQ